NNSRNGVLCGLLRNFSRTHSDRLLFKITQSCTKASMSTSSLSSNACHLCSTKKKGCDRLLPACSRCTDHNSICHYGSSYKGTHPISSSLLGPNLATRQDHDDLLTAHLFATLEVLDLGIEVVVDGYLRSIHEWIPIIHPLGLRRQAASLQSTPSAELACLILHILLITPVIPSASAPYNEPLLPSLYDNCKLAFILLQNYSRGHLQTIQSGLLLAIYEQGRGFVSDAYATLAICASLGHVTGLYQSLNLATVFSEEKMRVWWAIFFLDRLDTYSTGNSDRAPLVRDARLGAMLPREDDAWSQDLNISGPFQPLVFSADDVQTCGVFASEIQALFALQSVMQRTRDPSVEFETLFDHELWKLDMLIQKKIRETLTISWRRLEHQYTVVTVYLLQRLALNVAQELPLFVKESSIAALEMALTIAHDLMRMEKTADILKLDRMPLTAVILYKKVGLAAILLGKHYGRDTETLLREVIQMLSERISRRWKIALQIASQLHEALPVYKDVDMPRELKSSSLQLSPQDE
ncbi:C6 transcription factor, partial [Colletotrichum scovillei]